MSGAFPSQSMKWLKDRPEESFIQEWGKEDWTLA
jgi:hypothetical protein